MLPDWMKEIEVGSCPCCTVSTGKKRDFVQRTIADIFTFFEESLVNEGFAKRNGLLQSLDPRVKLVSILALIFAVCLTYDIRLLLGIYLLSLVFAYLSRVDILFFIKRVWVFVPIFAGIVMIPILFNIFMTGDTLIPVMTLGPGAHLGPFPLPETVAITRQGTVVALTFVLRVATCVSAAVLLFLTTPRDLLFKSLRSIRVPKVYVLTLDMCYRYIFLFIGMVKDFYLAKKSRTITPLPLIEEQKWVGGRVGYTLIKSLDMSGKVHNAMVSRGFDGDIRLLHRYTLHNRDYVAGFSILSLSVMLVLASRNLIPL